MVETSGFVAMAKPAEISPSLAKSFPGNISSNFSGLCLEKQLLFQSGHCRAGGKALKLGGESFSVGLSGK